MKSEMHDYVQRTLGYMAAGRLRSPKEQVGKVFVNADGRRLVVFKETVLNPRVGQTAQPAAMFRVQFQVAAIRPWRDRFIIALKSPIFVGAPGFRTKLWMVDAPNNTYQGVYEFETTEDAEAYAHSASMAFMRQVSVAGGLSYEIIPSGRLASVGSTLEIAAA